MQELSYWAVARDQGENVELHLFGSRDKARKSRRGGDSLYRVTDTGAHSDRHPEGLDSVWAAVRDGQVVDLFSTRQEARELKPEGTSVRKLFFS